MKEVLLYDLSNAFWRHWFATLSQFTAMDRVLSDVTYLAQNYDYVIVCADSPTNWRHEVTQELEPELQYKSHRQKKAPEAVLALKSTEDRLAALRFPFVRCDGYEADDVIATLCGQARGHYVYVKSEDKDMYQLISDNVTQITTGGFMTPEACERKFGVKPALIADLIAMMGDASDNIQGCPRVGATKAAALLNHFGSIDAIKSATFDELVEVRGVGAGVANEVLAWDPKMAQTLVSLSVDCDVELGKLIENYNPDLPEDFEDIAV